jgi:LysM repeat protein
VLNPGSKVVVTPPPKPKNAKAPVAPPVITVKDPDPMTDAGPGGKFEKDMLAALKKSVLAWATVLRTRKAAGPPAFPMAKANDIAQAAQDEVETSFGPLIQAASREVADLYHPGTFKLVTVLGDQSSRAIDAATRQGWTKYWMTLQGTGQEVLDKYKVLEWRDKAEFTRVLQLFALDKANEKDIDDAIHHWPAEAGTGTVFIQPYAAPAVDTKADRRNRWDLYTTLIHEMMHKVAHPNFQRTAIALGGSAQKYLTEGFADLMRHDVLWDGPGNLRKRLATDAMKAVRRKVEGADYPYDASVIVYHSDYPEVAKAREIAKAVGIENCKVAFFLGHTELLGIGAGTKSTTPLAGIAGWEKTDVAESTTYVTAAGDTAASIATKLGVAKGKLTDAAGKALGGGPIAAGTKLKAAGIRHIRAVRGDTLDSLARKNGVTTAALKLANGYAAATKDDTLVAAGARVLIPARP